MSSMDSAAALVSLFGTRRAQAPPSVLPPSGSLQIRAPLSSEDNDSPFSSEAASEEDFATASDTDEEGSDSALAMAAATAFKGASLSRTWSAPKAQLTWDDDSEVDIFEEGSEDDEEEEMGELSVVARVPLFGQNPNLVDKEVDSEADEPPPDTEVSAAIDDKFQQENLESSPDVNLKAEGEFDDGKDDIFVPGSKEDSTFEGSMNTNKKEDDSLECSSYEGQKAEETFHDEKDDKFPEYKEAADFVLEGSVNANQMDEDKAIGAEVESNGSSDSSYRKEEGLVQEEINSNAVNDLKAGIFCGADSEQHYEDVSAHLAQAIGNESTEQIHSLANSDYQEASSEKVEVINDNDNIPCSEIIMECKPSVASTELTNLIKDGDSSSVLVSPEESKLPSSDRNAKVCSHEENSLPDFLDARQSDHVFNVIDNNYNAIHNEAVGEEISFSSGESSRMIMENSKPENLMIIGQEDGSSYSCSKSELESSMNAYDNIAPNSDEEEKGYNEDDGKVLLNSDVLAAMLKGASNSRYNKPISVDSQDDSGISCHEGPADLGSSIQSPGHSSYFSPKLKDAVNPGLNAYAESQKDMTEEEKKMHDKLEQIKVTLLRLVHRLGHSPEDTVASQVLYRLNLAEGILHGRQLDLVSSLGEVKKMALQLEADGRDDLDFSCNILVLGKSGVGKSATINSIFGEEKSLTNAFEPATASVKVIVGTIDGVKIRVFDTPGLSSVMNQASNRRILSSTIKHTKKYPPDIVLYVDRIDTQIRDLNDIPLLRSITNTLGTSIWFKAVVVLTHAATAPPDGPSGSPLSYDMFVAQRSHVIQHSIRQVAGDMRLTTPVALAENHPSCRRNKEGMKVLPNGLNWKSRLLLLCYSSKILSEANSLLNIKGPSPGKLYGFRVCQLPLSFLLSSLLQTRPHPKLPADLGGDNGDSDVDLDDLLDAKEEEEDEYDQLPPFKPLKISQIAKLKKEQKRAYFDEFDYRVKLLQKKQWKEELRRLIQNKQTEKDPENDFPYTNTADDINLESGPATVPVPLPDMVLPPSFDCETPAYRYRFLEPTSQFLARPVLNLQGWDHDCGYDGVNIEHSLPIAGQFPTLLSAQVIKNKKEFNIHLDSSITAKHGENGSTLIGLDVQTIGKQLGYIMRSETKFRNLKKNKTAGGVSLTFLGENVVTGIKLEDQLSIGKRINLVASAGVVQTAGDIAYGAKLEARLRDKDYPIAQALSTLGLSLMNSRGDMALGANLQSHFIIGRNSNMVVRVGLNNKLSGQITVRTSTSEQLQIALVGILPILMSLFQSIKLGEKINA